MISCLDLMVDFLINAEVSLSNRAVGSLGISTYVGVERSSRTFSLYEEVSKITLALPLSAGRINTSSLSLSRLRASLSARVVLRGGGLALRMIRAVSWRMSSAVSLGKWEMADSTPQMIMSVGICEAVGTKLSPFDSKDVVGSSITALDRLMTVFVMLWKVLGSWVLASLLNLLV